MCEAFGQAVADELNIVLAAHIFCVVFCFASEVYETLVGFFGNVLRICEFVCVLLSLFTNLENVTLVFQYLTHIK